MFILHQMICRPVPERTAREKLSTLGEVDGLRSGSWRYAALCRLGDQRIPTETARGKKNHFWFSLKISYYRKRSEYFPFFYLCGGSSVNVGFSVNASEETLLSLLL